MKQIILSSVLLTGSLMAVDWDHVSGMCDVKMDAPASCILTHIERVCLKAIEHARESNADIITFETLREDQLEDLVYEELKEDYAHFYIGTDASGTSCIASKYAIDPSLFVTDGYESYSLKEGSSLDMFITIGRKNTSSRATSKEVEEEAKDADVTVICYHNDRDGISYDDIIEHIGNGEYGSAWRDAKEKDEIQEVLSDIKEIAFSLLETIGDEALRGQDD